MTGATVFFSILDRQILVTDAESGATRWFGAPLDMAVDEMQPLPDEDRAVVLLDYTSGPAGPSQNLVCIDPNGQVVWRAELPTQSSTEAYVSFNIDGSSLTANSWSGHRVGLDLETGRIIESRFTK